MYRGDDKGTVISKTVHLGDGEYFQTGPLGRSRDEH